MQATAAANADHQTAIFINLPVWLSPPQQAFAMGEEGAMLMPAVDKIETLVSVHTGQPAQIEVIRVDGIRTELDYHSGLIGTGPDWSELTGDPARIFVASYEPERITIQPAGWLQPGTRVDDPLADFGELVTLVDAAVNESDQGWRLDLTWRVNEALTPDIALFVHILDADGQLIGQADGDPVAGTYPFWFWAPGTIAGDSRLLSAGDQATEVRIGLYSWATGERLAATSPVGDHFPDDAYVLPIEP